MLESVLLAFAVLIPSLSFHEAAHAWTANRLGDPTARLLGRLTLNPLAHIDWIGTVLFPLISMMSNFPLIGWAKPVPVSMGRLRDPRRDFAIVALAGPVSNLLLAGVCLILFHIVSSPTNESSVWVYWLRSMVLTNVLLAVFNMIPVPPLDGGNVLMGVVSEGTAHAIGWLRPYGFLLLYALMFTGTLGRIIFPLQESVKQWLK